MTNYTATYLQETILGERGHIYRCYADGRLIFEGWTAGGKSEAESEVWQGIKAREALLTKVEP